MTFLQLALLAKAVLIAVLGEDALWPDGRGKVGLLYLFAAICASLLLLGAEMLSAHALISGQDYTPFSSVHGSGHAFVPAKQAHHHVDSSLSECPGWEEGVGEGGGEAAEPLLDKPAQRSSPGKKSTVAVLAGYSAQDTPLLLLAFLAGTALLPPYLLQGHVLIMLHHFIRLCKCRQFCTTVLNHRRLCRRLIDTHKDCGRHTGACNATHRRAVAPACRDGGSPGAGADTLLHGGDHRLRVHRPRRAGFPVDLREADRCRARLRRLHRRARRALHGVLTPQTPVTLPVSSALISTMQALMRQSDNETIPHCCSLKSLEGCGHRLMPTTTVH